MTAAKYNRFSVNLSNDEFAALEEYRRLQPVIPSRSEAAKDLMNLGLACQGDGLEKIMASLAGVKIQIDSNWPRAIGLYLGAVQLLYVYVVVPKELEALLGQGLKSRKGMKEALEMLAGFVCGKQSLLSL